MYPGMWQTLEPRPRRMFGPGRNYPKTRMVACKIIIRTSSVIINQPMLVAIKEVIMSSVIISQLMPVITKQINVTLGSSYAECLPNHADIQVVDCNLQGMQLHVGRDSHMKGQALLGRATVFEQAPGQHLSHATGAALACIARLCQTSQVSFLIQ